jgi:hypothetical protein
MHRYIYICSAGHSGSTLLDMLIGSHSRIASLGELNQLSKNIALNTECSCGDAIRSCKLWSEVIRAVGDQLGVDLASDPYQLFLGYPLASTVVDEHHQTRAYLLKRRLMLGIQYVQLRHRIGWLVPLLRQLTIGVENCARVFEAVSEELGVDAVVDSSKSYLNALQLYQRYPEQVRIILLTRDGRGVLWSNLKRGESRDRAIRNWRNRYDRAVPLMQLRVPKEHWLQIRYEDLTSDTAVVLQSVCRLIGVPYEERMLRFREKIHHIVNGNRMRLTDMSEVRTDIEWKFRLTPNDLRHFNRTAGRINQLLGYV